MTDDGLFDGGKSPNVTGEGQAGVDDPHSDIFFAAIETTRMPMILTDPNQPDNPIVFANQAFLNMTGYTISEIAGRNCRFLQGPETDPDTVAEVRNAIENKGKVAVEILNYRKDGASFWNALFISPVENKDGKLVYFFASQLDVSRRRDAEAALRQSQKMEAVGQLTGGIAHDFNNLLQVILGSLELLKRRSSFKDDAQAIRLLGAMDDSANRAKTLTQQLLAFSRKQKLEGRVVNLNALVGEMRDLTDRTIGSDITFIYEYEPDLWNARIDPTQAEMAILNIIINARDAMPDGGRITIRTSNVEIEQGDEANYEGILPGQYVRVSITDTGTGMPESIVKRVMDPFFTTKEEGKGTGLGLSMVYGFAKQSGGIAKIYSEEGVGTTVSLYFPASGDMEKFKSEGKNRALDQGGDERILVVDDRADVAELARAMLEDAGYTVETAVNGDDALKKLSEGEPFDLLFSDVIMPGGLNGVSLARKARMSQPKLKVLLTTGYAEASIERTDISGSAFDIITKPYTRMELIRKLRLVLDGPTGVT